MSRSVPDFSGQAASSTADAFRTIAESSGDIAFIVDCTADRLVYLSPGLSDLIGFDHADVQQQLTQGGNGPLAALCGGLPERLRRFAAGDGSRLRVVRDVDVQRPDGRMVPVEVISTLMPDADGKPAALAGLVRDQSARRARALEQKRFASMLNHEFRTPLSTIDGAIQRLESTGIHADETTRQRYRKIGVATDRLIAMLDEYLSPERMAELGTQRRANTVSPRLLLDEVVAQARVAGRQVALEVDQLPASLRCEPAGLRLALKLLLDNALRYSPVGSPLAVSGRIAGGGVELAVRNEGHGVPPADAPHIFGKGYRGTNAAGLPGSGLGLYMARSVVDVHGGSVGHIVPAQGGAEFRLWLPAQENEPKTLPTANPAVIIEQGKQG